MNGRNLSNVVLDTSKPLVEEYRDDILDGVLTIKAQGKRMKAEEWNSDALYSIEPVGFKDTQVTLVPYCNWGNRGSGEMAVWIKTL